MSPDKSRKLTPQEQSQILMGINMHKVDSPMGYTMVISGNSFTTFGSYAGIINKLEKEYPKKPECYVLYPLSSNPNVISIDCKIPVENKSKDEKLELRDIRDIIEEITATNEGKRLWQEAQEKVNSELWEEVIQGSISRIKYFRIIRGFTQKELADKASMKQPDIARIEKPGHKGHIATYEKLAEVLGIEYKELMP